MRYACLVYLDGRKLARLTDAELARLRREATACEEELRRGGHLVSAEALETVGSATTIRVRDGRSLAVDGPAIDARDQVFGVLVLEARDLNDAMRLAAKHPLGRLGRIEIRPVRREPGNARGDAG